MTLSLTTLVTMLLGLVIWLAGRQLFWLFVAIVGFAVTFELATQFLAGQPEWVALLIGLLVGVIGAVLAVYLEYILVAIAGFAAGAYILISLARVYWADAQSLLWLFGLIGGLIGAFLVVMLFDWALIILSAATGANLLVQPFALTPTVNALVFLALLAVGIGVQATAFSGTRRPRRRVVARRQRKQSS